MKTQILDSKGFNYLTDVLKANNLTDLPDNVILNKVTTGSGMTTAAIVSETPYVIAVPLKRLIQNKLEWAKRNKIDMLGVYNVQESGIDYQDILEFGGNKIMVTYDSLPKVVKALTENNRIKDFKIMIDECHHIIKSGNFRFGAIDNLLDSYTKFKSYIFGTATPVDDRYQHPKLREIPKVQVKWYNLEPVTVNYCVYYEDLLKAVAINAIKHITGEIKSNAHFFINSVNDIITVVRNIIKGGYDNADKIRIITAGSDENEAKIIAGLGKGYTIADVNSQSRVINFYTSTCFDGVDFFDENGLPYIVSNGSKDHTKIDIITQLPQIIGRLRDTKYSNFVNLLYSPNKYFSHISEEEFEAFTKKKIEEAKQFVDRYEKETLEMVKDALLSSARENAYLQVKDDNVTIIVNETALYSEMQNYKTLHTTYYHTKKDKDNKQQNESQSVVINEISYLYEPLEVVEITGLNKAQIGQKTSFAQLCESYNEANEIVKSEIAKLHPIIKEAYAVLGFDKIKALKFRQSNIKEALIIHSEINSNGWKIANLLDYRVGEWVSREEVKSRLQGIYGQLNLNVTAKSTDIENYYEVKESSKRVSGVLVKGLAIVSCKFKKTTIH
jgi:hypothetical protein